MSTGVRGMRWTMMGAGVLATLVLEGCGGGGSPGGATLSSTGTSGSTGSTGSSGSTGGGGSYVANQFMDKATYAAKCASPRSGKDPLSGTAYPDTQGTATDENNFLRSWTHQLYLWFDQVADQNPALYSTSDYFELLKTMQNSASGAPVDKFHFTYTTSMWESLSMQGVQVGYGVAFDVLAAKPPRNITVAYVDPGASGQAATLARGAVVQSIDGTDINVNTTAGVNALNAALSPASLGETHTFIVLDAGATTPRTLTLTATNTPQTPVPVVTALTANGGKVGYILFNSHIATAESELISAFASLKSQNVTDLVLDIRYNGGGFLDLASEVAYMIAGAGPTAGRTFELQQFNSQYSSTNPVTGATITPTQFHSTSQGFSGTAGQALPTLNLSRVFVLTSAQTCSASEAIMNGLQGVNVQVVMIGSTTCGKPYGFYPQDNCGTTYFSIQFRGVNAKGIGDYTDGFSPANTVSPPGVVVPGCSVADDFGHALGDPNEGQLSQALAYRTGGACTVPPSGAAIAGLKHEMPAALAVTAHYGLPGMRILRR